ncbi:bifunctional 3'-5' exonuclease/DNA polymerase [Ruicaihuangia caeni]|uniref:DNA-directed DNA polymerase n=1 Tax=Ruicaihuangia caeni TaxID=3042517 RepID=A0AAW6T857_9MICO|nr:bifunctional 3'-5' exonuclease/DNA polymerase [Klugiella sp. YN-L-19]MDI2097968.1 bifunctional 3'-5' exonuclease/DNA polymerase [Klugiella sp. YN-L-19]
MQIVLEQLDGGAIGATEIDGTGNEKAIERVAREQLPAFVAAREHAGRGEAASEPVVSEQRADAQPPRWVWDDTAVWYPELLRAGVTIERCFDLRLTDALLRNSPHTAAGYSALPAVQQRRHHDSADAALFHLEQPAPPSMAPVAALQRQQSALETSPAGLRLLVAAESAGALAAAEMGHAGLPWRRDEHERLLASMLGARPAEGYRPERLERLALAVADALGAPTINLDSPAELLRTLRSAGLAVETTRSHELQRLRHPAIAPLLEYKTLSRLWSANGWHWLDQWVHQGRFHPVFVPAGVVSGRWSSEGGGALQLPAVVRSAVRADEGWKLIVADAAQLEPRVLAAMSGDSAMARASSSGDLYQGMVDVGAVETRAQAKYGMLGAMYGGTTGESAKVLPRIARAFPRAIGFVEAAAQRGERGMPVSSLLGRGSPEPSEAWRELQAAASAESPDPVTVRRARSAARSQGRFTRNFVVQATAAEWALAWIALLRGALRQRYGADHTTSPHLVFFVHDELIVHAPAHHAEDVRELMHRTAADAGRLLFGESAVAFPVNAVVVDGYDEAK